MKYFTREWGSGSQTERQSDNLRRAYWKKITNLKLKFPAALRELAFKTNIHDGLIRKIILDKKQKKLSLNLLCGDLQVGYFNLDLIYTGLDLKKLSTSVLRQIVDDPETEALYDEVDIQNGYYVHSILFWPKGEVDIYFKALKILKTSRKNRVVLTKQDSRYEERK